MEIVITIIQSIAVLLGIMTALTSLLFFRPLHWPAPFFWFLKLYASALSPLLVLLGVLITIVGIATGSFFIGLIGIFNIIIYGVHIYSVTRPPDASSNFEKAFVLQWEKKIKPELKNSFLPTRTVLILPAVPDPRLEQNIPFATITGTDRKLLCDVWQPPKNVASSGLAFIYVHGSAFYILDKDFYTRPFFRHLAAQGHVIMDVAHRLAPETDMMGMVNDIKRAVAWMKENANIYGVNAKRIVLGGGSAGAHLAMQTAYTANDAQFTPKELEEKDLSVCAVVSIYGSNDLEALYYHTNQHITVLSGPGSNKKAVPTKMPGWIVKKWEQSIIAWDLIKTSKTRERYHHFWVGLPTSALAYMRFTHQLHMCIPVVLPPC